jgi:hypothetical protein
MKKLLQILILMMMPMVTKGQGNQGLSFSGQASAWANVNPENQLPLWMGARYLPQVNYRTNTTGGKLLDFEASANINGSAGSSLFDSLSHKGQLKPYRAWVRFSGNQFELRLGLQKINFGSASMLRPLMWFDQMDPRDPLQFTDGVWGLLGRYYFISNVNIWVWGLYGNEGPKSWEIGKTDKRIPEFGGRLQLPVPRGETALSFHHRNVDIQPLLDYLPYDNLPESRIGLDGKWDVEVGLWFEAVWIKKQRDLDLLTHQQIINLGIDYTFGIGNGLNVVAEHLLFSPDRNAFEFIQPIHFSGLSASYPISMFDNINVITYYNWTDNNTYNFINWKRDYNHLSFYLMAFWNPKTFQLPQQTESGNLFSGRGFQLMLVYNH